MHLIKPIQSCNLGQVYKTLGKKQTLRLFAPTGFSRGKGVLSLQPFVLTDSLFVHVPKAAGISLNLALYDCYGSEHKTIRQYRSMFRPSYFSKIFKFTFVRNPFDRLFSAYTYLLGGGMNKSDSEFGDYLRIRYPTFEHLVLEGLETDKVSSFRHFLPQSHLICSDDGTLSDLDFIGRFETLESDFSKVAAVVRPSAELPHANRSKRELRHEYRSVYTSEMIDQVAKVYEWDIRSLNYEFEGVRPKV